jgi:hypothetical protein
VKPFRFESYDQFCADDKQGAAAATSSAETRGRYRMAAGVCCSYAGRGFPRLHLMVDLPSNELEERIAHLAQGQKDVGHSGSASDDAHLVRSPTAIVCGGILQSAGPAGPVPSAFLFVPSFVPSLVEGDEASN